MIESFIDSTILIDNTPSEVQGLQEVLDSKNIFYNYYEPKKVFTKKRFKLKNRKLIFLDLFIDDKLTGATSQISLIRKYFKQIVGKDFGTYGIVLWTKHLEEIDQFKEKIAQDGELYTLPLFVVGLDKTRYLTDGFENVFEDIENILMTNSAASFFIRWSNAIEKGKSQTITDIFSLIKDYNLQDENLNFLLYLLAKNQTGISHTNLSTYPLHEDAYKAFSELLMYEISSQMTNTNCKLFNPIQDLRYHYISGTDTISKDYADTYYKNGVNANVSKTDKKALEADLKLNYTKINSKILLDENLKHKHILPGNIYKIKDQKSLFLSEKLDTTKNDVPIIIEMTPPCDFANSKKAHPKCLGGFIADYDPKRIDTLKGEAFYTEPHPLKLESYPDDKMIVFDFRYVGILSEKDLVKKQKYELLYRAKDKLFADILQKLSSHIARLGLAVLH